MKTRKPRKRLAHAPVPQAGFRPTQFWPAVGMSRSGGYQLPKELQPRSILMGKKTRIITESPAEYLARVGAQLSAAKG